MCVCLTKSICDTLLDMSAVAVYHVTLYYSRHRSLSPSRHSVVIRSIDIIPLYHAIDHSLSISSLFLTRLNPFLGFC